VAKNLSISAEN